MNNLRMIREIYGATQEEIAIAIGVNRVSVTNWENDVVKPSRSKQEKLSIFYGIGPEYFFEKEVDDIPRNMLIKSAERAKEIDAKNNLTKEEHFHKVFSEITFKEAIERYMYSMKMLLATADDGELEKLQQALLINHKMGARLNAIIELRKIELDSEEPTLFELFDEMKNI